MCHHAVEVVSTPLRHGLAKFRNLLGPSGKRLQIRRTQQCVPVSQGTQIPTKNLCIVLFHVKHAPVQPLPATGRATEHQLRQVRQQQLDRKQRGNPGCLSNDLSIAPEFHPAPPFPRIGQTHAPHQFVRQQSRNRHPLLPVADYAVWAGRSEGTSANYEVDGLQGGCLSRPVRPHKQVDARVELKPVGVNVADIADVDPFNDHRPGCPERRLAGWNASLYRVACGRYWRLGITR